MERKNAHKLWNGLALGLDFALKFGKTITCNHGCGELPNLEHPVSSFMRDFIDHWSKSAACTSILEIITSPFQTHLQVLNDEIYREMVVNIMIRIGTNMLLCEDRVEQALTLAKVINILKHHGGTSNFDVVYNSRKIRTKMRDLDIDITSNSGRRDALKFYSKRVSCSCLKKMHQEARRTILKMGFCYGCQQEKERVILSVCSRCMILQYCSRECQVAHRPRHKEDCALYALAHKKQTEQIRHYHNGNW